MSRKGLEFQSYQGNDFSNKINYAINTSKETTTMRHYLDMFNLRKKTTKNVYLALLSILLIYTSYIMISSRAVLKINLNNIYYYTFIDGAKYNSANSHYCHIPQLDPWDPTILKYLTKFKPLQCKTLQHELTYIDNNGYLCINRTAQGESGYKNLKCKFRCFEKANGVDDVTIIYGQWIDFEKRETVEIGCEFVEVTCSGSISAISIYSNLHNRIIYNNTLVVDLRSRQKKIRNKDPPLNILLFVLDSISKSNFVRYLPKFFKVLQEDYDSIILNGYTKVGDNSFPNAAAFLTGKRTHVAGYEPELPNDMSESYFDDWPLIWKNFSKRGYATFYAEDFPNFNLFQYRSNGFKFSPVDHYFRPYWLQLWNSFLHRRSTHLCYGNSAKHNLQLNYLKQFFHTYNDSVPKFAFNWLTELGHDWLGQIALGDEDFSKLFTKLHSLLIKNTFVIVLSDHGHRFDAIRESVIGRIEERMPFCALSVPKWFRRKYPKLYENLKLNSDSLTSPYDLYATLQDVLENNFPKTVHFSKAFSAKQRGISLFRQIPATRQCADAGIPEEYCICQEEFQVNVNDPKVLVAALIVVDYVNVMLTNFSAVCHQLVLKNVKNAQSFLPNSNMLFTGGRKFPFYSETVTEGFYINYRITVEVSPSDGLLEAMLKYSVLNNKFVIVGDVNRINKYGNQSSCVNSLLLEKYCYCF